MLIAVLALTGINVTLNYKKLQVRKEIITTDKLKNQNLLIAYFSDLYFGNENDGSRLEEICDKLNSFNPDVVIFGGDLLDDNYSPAKEEVILDKLSKLSPTYGKFAVLGDNDLISENRRSIVENILSQAGFEIMDNQSKTISFDLNNRINLVGVGNCINGSPNTAAAFSEISVNGYTFVISHTPDTFNDLNEQQFDYMLSGHSLGGKIRIPLVSWLLADEGARHFYHGKIHNNDKVLDISNGSGTPMEPYRFLADPEIVFYSLRGK